MGNLESVVSSVGSVIEAGKGAASVSAHSFQVDEDDMSLCYGEEEEILRSLAETITRKTNVREASSFAACLGSFYDSHGSVFIATRVRLRYYCIVHMIVIMWTSITRRMVSTTTIPRQVTAGADRPSKDLSKECQRGSMSAESAVRHHSLSTVSAELSSRWA